MTDRELLQAALDALNLINHRGNTDDELMQVGQTITQIQERLTEPDNQTETELFTYIKGYEDGKQYVTHRVKRVLEGKYVPASIDCGLLEIKDKSTVANLNLADGVYRLLAMRGGER